MVEGKTQVSRLVDVRHVIVAAGTKKVYQGHPTTVTTADGRTISLRGSPIGGVRVVG